jgi:hypothetical protein
VCIGRSDVPLPAVLVSNFSLLPSFSSAAVPFISAAYYAQLPILPNCPLCPIAYFAQLPIMPNMHIMPIMPNCLLFIATFEGTLR